VADEISECKSIYHARIDLKRETWISVRTLRSESQVRLLLPLPDGGEAEVIALAIEENAKLLLLDELTARKVAKSLNLNVLGTVGILIRAKQMGEIAFVKPFLENMIQKGIRYSQKFLIFVLQDIGE
jgi:predicted nucleic acid-binding protein